MNKKIEILFPLFLYFLTISGLIAILKNPAVGYELSIYESSFNEFIFIIVSSIGAIIYVYFIDKERKFLIITVLILIIMNNFILLSLPGLRGYIIQGDMDSLTHLGYMKDIVTKGYSNIIIYPISHILIVNIFLLANISFIQTVAYISQFFSVLYVIYIYLLSKKISNDQSQSILIILSSITFLFLGFEAEFKPQFLSLIVIPMFLYFLFTNKSFGARIILVMLIILIQFFHPLTSFFFIIGILLMIIYTLIIKRKHIFASYNDCRNLISIGMVSFILWIYNFPNFWNSNIIRIFKKTIGEGSTSSTTMSNVASSFSKLKLTTFDIIELFMRMYGHILIFVMISFIFVVYYLKFKEKKDSKKDLINILIILFISGIIIQMLIMGGVISLYIFRGLNYVVILTPIFVGSLLFQLKKNYFMRRKIIISIIILSIISISWLIGVFGLFPSPYIHSPNYQITKTDIDGAKWFYNYKNPSTSYIGGLIYTRFSHLILGVDETRKSDYLFSWDDVPGEDNENLKEFLKRSFDIEWIQTAKIEKIDNRALKIFTDKNHLSLRILENGTNITTANVKLKIDDGRTSELVVRSENNKLNIYKAHTRWEFMLPDHFNYDKINLIGENFTENMYMIVTIYDKLLYTVGPWKSVGRFTNEDFDNLSYDISVNNLYDNGAMNIFYIKRF